MKANSPRVMQLVIDRAWIWTGSLCSPILHHPRVMMRCECCLDENEPSIKRDSVGTNLGSPRRPNLQDSGKNPWKCQAGHLSGQLFVLSLEDINCAGNPSWADCGAGCRLSLPLLVSINIIQFLDFS